MEAGVEHRVHRLARVGERDRDVQEELAARRIRDDGALVADDRIVEPACSRYGRTARNIRPVTTITCTPAARTARERRARARSQHAVLGDQRPVEIEGESGDVAAGSPPEGLRGVPPVAVTT